MWMDANDHNGDGTADTSEADITSWSGQIRQYPTLDGVQGDPRFTQHLNGLGVVDFDNTGGNNGRHILWQTDNAKSLAAWIIPSKFSVFAVSRYTGTDSEIVIGNADNWNWHFADRGNNYNRVAHFNVGFTTLTTVFQDDNNWHLYEATMSDQDRGNCWLTVKFVESTATVPITPTTAQQENSDLVAKDGQMAKEMINKANNRGIYRGQPRGFRNRAC